MLSEHPVHGSWLPHLCHIFPSKTLLFLPTPSDGQNRGIKDSSYFMHLTKSENGTKV